MNINSYQGQTLNTAMYPEAGQNTERELNYLIHGLTGEAGELSNKFKKLIRSQAVILSQNMTVELSNDQRLSLLDELGDVLWYMARMARVLGCSMEELAAMNYKKLMARQSQGQLHDHK